MPKIDGAAIPEPDVTSDDHYRVLGVATTATKAELSRSYRNLALQWHPDKNAGSQEAHQNFTRVSRTVYLDKLNAPCCRSPLPTRYCLMTPLVLNTTRIATTLAAPFRVTTLSSFSGASSCLCCCVNRHWHWVQCVLRFGSKWNGSWR